ncbi:anaerobic ribonucleoside-triphosphate reductase activating protein [Methanobrevibacter sp. TMH8]|uniref:anaerobic ribonucleoside-triphosphate reductase activating protein n=1 Tax=Methanobrevibacter sp. TMH8 TaxID=2848611 RepID=UPI001CCA111B|nr:anaerobic ribonucleoside-triphosphate reductase activating protein [Methanobrevibacter sp. TMH8]MBZ9570088.1 anaerobic ribonucleoside-triphosphate reductase activating protein [Methanobrevibacter sp. TMH8]
MEVGGTIISSIEYDGKISLVIFMAKCPLRCPYCQNSELLENGEETSLQEIFELIDDSQDYIDAVVVSGGEPLVHSGDVIKILKYAKSLGLKTKVDTSGCYPKRLDEILKYTDYIAIDIKAPFDKYKEIIGTDIGNNVKKSMKIANNSDNTFLECRTTYVPTLLDHDDIKQISNEIECDLYTLQQFRNKSVLDERLEKIESPNPNELRKLAKEIKPVLNKVKVKTAEFGEECI